MELTFSAKGENTKSKHCRKLNDRELRTPCVKMAGLPDSIMSSSSSLVVVLPAAGKQEKNRPLLLNTLHDSDTDSLLNYRLELAITLL